MTASGASPRDPDVEIHLDISPYAGGKILPGQEELAYTSSYLGESGEPALRIWQVAGGDYLRLGYYDGMQFWMDRVGKNVWALWPDTSSLHDAATYLLGPVLGLLLRLRSITCLHASAVSFGDRAAAFVGAEGAGKSTTAAALARRGHRVLSDDVVALAEREGTFYVMPAYPYLCLWPDSVETLYGSSDALPRLTPNWEKRCLTLGDRGTLFEERALPLGAIYILVNRRTDSAPCVEEISAPKALLTLVANTYASNMLDREMRAMEFAVLGRLVSSVAIRQLCAHQDAHRLEELCQLVTQDFQALDLGKAVQNAR